MENLRENIEPHLWGGIFWKTLYYCAKGMHEKPTSEDKAALTKMIDQLKHLLPCEKCRENLAKKRYAEAIAAAATKLDVIQAILDMEN